MPDSSNTSVSMVPPGDYCKGCTDAVGSVMEKRKRRTSGGQYKHTDGQT